MALPDVLQLQGNLTTEAGVYIAGEKMVNPLATTTTFQLKVSLNVVWDAHIFLSVGKDECTWEQLKAIAIFDVLRYPFLPAIDRTANTALPFDDITKANID
jgi:hypothetical protein